jgi:ligand-binding sensor domain-containing protein
MALDLRRWHKPRDVGVAWVDHLGIYEIGRLDRLLGATRLFNLIDSFFSSVWRAEPPGLAAFSRTRCKIREAPAATFTSSTQDT